MIGNKYYLFLSFFVAGAAVINSYLTYEEFYPTVIHIVKSKSIVLLLFNSAVALSVLLFKFLTLVFFSSLKDAEIQNMESEAMRHGFNFIIVLYMLHLDFNIYIAFHIFSNIAVYSLHTLASKRVEYLFTDNYPTKSYIQMFIFHILLICLDLSLMIFESGDNYKTLNTFLKFEYILLAINATKSFSVYLLQIYEMIFKSQGWENKAFCISIVEFLANLTTLAVLVFEYIVLSKKSYIGIYFLEKSFRAVLNMWKTLSGFLESRKLVNKVNTFPNATQEEIHQASDKCIFCLEALTEAKKINCGHLFHYKCLRSYFENSNNPKCPTCRASIDDKKVVHHKTEHFTQNVASSFLLQDLPTGVNFMGKPVDIGATAWGLPKTIKSHRILKDEENMKHAFESMNEFILRFYKHPPDMYEGAEASGNEARYASVRDIMAGFNR